MKYAYNHKSTKKEDYKTYICKNLRKCLVKLYYIENTLNRIDPDDASHYEPPHLKGFR